MKNRQQRKKSDSLGPIYKDMLTITPTAFGDTAGGSARNYIIDTGDEVAIGADTHFETLETDGQIKKIAGSMITFFLREMKEQYGGLPGTVGELVEAKAARSVLLPMLVSLKVDVVLHHKGRMCLRDYISCPPLGERVQEIRIVKEKVFASYAAVRQEQTRIPYVTAAIAVREEGWRVVIGARPGVAVVAAGAGTELTEKGIDVRENAAHLAAEETEFGDDALCTAAERRQMTAAIVRVLIKQAWQGYNKL